MPSAVADRPNKVTIKDAGPCRKKINVEVPAETVTDHVKEQMETVVVEAELPGFRKGRAPRRLVEKRFGAAVRQQAKERLISTALSKAIEDAKLRVLGQPTAESLENVTVEEGKPLAFEVEVEVLPEFELPKLDGLPIKKPLIPVTDEMIEGEVKKLCIQEGALEERQTPEPGDYLTGHAKMTDPDGKVHFESDGIVVQVPPKENKGKGMIVGLVVDDLAKQLGQPKPGEPATIKTTGPDNHENEDLRGVKLSVVYTPARVDRIIPAEAGSIALRLGMSDEQQLKDFISQRLHQRVLIDQVAAMRAQAAKWLIDNTKMDLPQRFTGEQAKRNLARKRLELMYRGEDPMKIEQAVAEMRSVSSKAAQNELKIFFVLDKTAEALRVNVTEQEINGRIAQMAMERNERPDRLRQALVQNNQIQGIAMQIREHKTLDAVVGKANVTEVSLEDYNKSVRESAAKDKD